MAEINKPDYTYLWSSGGSIVAPSNVKIQTGWTAEVPPFQWENWSQNRQDQAIAHILQHGVSVWDDDTEYQAGKSYVTGSNGKIYVAITTNTNSNPTTDTSEVNWADVNGTGFLVLTTTGTNSWTVPPLLKLGIKRPKVTVIGGGGGGGGATSSGSFGVGGGGGGGGGASIALPSLTGVSSVLVTVGVGGVAGVSPTFTGGAGGTSSFGGFCSATGGVGGAGTTSASATANSGGGGGLGSSGILNISGCPGGDASLVSLAASTVVFGGNGGSAAVLGGGADGGGTGTGGGANSFGAGGAGGSAFNTTANGGVGANGCVIIEW